MTRLWLVRHAEAEGNLFRRIHGVTDAPLTAFGQRQLSCLGARFASVPLEAVYASGLTRARETAAAIAGPHGLKVRVLPELHEVDMGEWEDRTWGEAAHSAPEQYYALNQDPEKFTVPGCERYEDSLRRILGAVAVISRENPEGSVAAVAHGCIIRLLLNHLLGNAPSEIVKVPHGDNTCVAELLIDGGEITVLRYNDNSHLPEELSAFAREDWWKNADGKDGRDLRFRPFDPSGPLGGRTYLRRYRETWVVSHGTELGFSDIYLEKARAKAARDPSTLLEVLSEDVPCGMLELSPAKGEEEGAGHVTLLFLEEDYRGMGLGVQLIGQAVSHYRKLGRRFLRLNVTETNYKAIRFYEKWGFEKKDTEPDAFGFSYVMERPL